MMASDMRWWRLAFKRSCRMTQTATLSSPASKTFSIVITFISIFFKETSKEENIWFSGYWKACLAKIKLICFSICTCKKISWSSLAISTFWIKYEKNFQSITIFYLNKKYICFKDTIFISLKYKVGHSNKKE